MWVPSCLEPFNVCDTGSCAFSSSAGSPLQTDATSCVSYKEKEKHDSVANIKAKRVLCLLVKSGFCKAFPCLWGAHDNRLCRVAVGRYWSVELAEDSGTLSRISRRTACCYSASWNRNKGVSPSAD